MNNDNNNTAVGRLLMNGRIMHLEIIGRSNGMPPNTFSSHSEITMSERKQVAFIGLGAMGWGIAANLAAAAKDGKIASPVLVWNRTTLKSEQHEC